jgi:hypothetical protein
VWRPAYNVAVFASDVASNEILWVSDFVQESGGPAAAYDGVVPFSIDLEAPCVIEFRCSLDGVHIGRTELTVVGMPEHMKLE